MDKLLIILKKEGIRLYDIDGSKTKIHLIRGEEETDTEEYAEVAESLRDSYNDDELSEVELDLLYTNNNTEIVKGFTEELLPCGGWQVFSFKKILPEILLKNNMLKPDESVTVQYDGEAYTASMTKNGKIELTTAESGTELHDSDIAAIYADKFNVFADGEKQEKLQHQIKELQQECEKKDNELKRLGEELRQAKDKLEKADNTKREANTTDTENKYDSRRRMVYSTIRGPITWKIEPMDYVKKDQVIATGGESQLIAPISGCFIGVEPSELPNEVVLGRLLGVIVDRNELSSDYRENLDFWLESMDVYKKIQPIYCKAHGSIILAAKSYKKYCKSEIIGNGGWREWGTWCERNITALFTGILYEIKKIEANENGEKRWANPFNVDKLIAILVPEDMHMDELLAFKKGYKDERTEFDKRAENFFNGGKTEE